jgi:hypothetical protein
MEETKMTSDQELTMDALQQTDANRKNGIPRKTA